MGRTLRASTMPDAPSPCGASAALVAASLRCPANLQGWWGCQLSDVDMQDKKRRACYRRNDMPRHVSRIKIFQHFCEFRCAAVWLQQALLFVVGCLVHLSSIFHLARCCMIFVPWSGDQGLVLGLEGPGALGLALPRRDLKIISNFCDL